MGMKMTSFTVKFEKELDDLRRFRNALRNFEKMVVYDEIIRACMAEQSALTNADIPSALDAILLTASLIDRKLINCVARQVNLLEVNILKLESGVNNVENEDVVSLGLRKNYAKSQPYLR
ncbi:MAG: Rad51 protein [Thermoproteota archaeon]|nr:Rad51 protein [Thermoproteota archaeon]